MKKLLISVSCLCMLAITSLAIYYLGFYLPRLNQQKLADQKTQQEASAKEQRYKDCQQAFEATQKNAKSNTLGLVPVSPCGQ